MAPEPLRVTVLPEHTVVLLADAVMATGWVIVTLTAAVGQLLVFPTMHVYTPADKPVATELVPPDGIQL